MVNQHATPRRAARVILVDTEGRVLLFRGGDPNRPEAGTWWFTVGGGLLPGETPEAGAGRELLEETGLRVSDVGPALFERELAFEFGGRLFHQREQYFLVRCEPFAVSDALWTSEERQVLQEHRWWTVGDLQATGDTVYPEGLCEFVAGVLQGG
jgi:8-oxo-dGTP pyrophosphatase MutT (NUDIX family)